MLPLPAFPEHPLEGNELNELNVFERHESEVRSYCRHFPAVFRRAKGHMLEDIEGREYIDFFAGAGALNYGHNEPAMQQALIDYVRTDGITHSLDMSTEARGRFLERFHEIVLAPRGLDYKVMFPGPTGTNCIEAALKLARKLTGRQLIVSFTGGFHGMTLGSLAATANPFKRHGAGVPLNNVVFMPYDGFLGEEVDSLDYFEAMLSAPHSGLDRPAGVLVECIQGEGGINVARVKWLQRLAAICRQHDIRLIVDEVQTGCGRTGPFFRFEAAGIVPDIVCVSKSISGIGLPLALTLIRPEYDRFAPGEHNGTFRGQNLSLTTAVVALENYWRDDELEHGTVARGEIVREALEAIAARHPVLNATVRGVGLMQGLAIPVGGLAETICRAAFDHGLIVETAGVRGEVAKIFPPLTIELPALREGLERLAAATDSVLAQTAAA